MNILAIDTSTADLVTGVSARKGDAGITVDIERDTRAHNEKLMPKIDALLASSGCSYAALDAVVVGCGPGPFTGLRVGMSTAQALADALRIPVYGVCSHDAVAWELQSGGVRGSVLVATDARRKEIYYSTFILTDEGIERTYGPDVIKPEELLLEQAPEFVCIPEGLYGRLAPQYRVERVEAGPHPPGLMRAAGISGDSAQLPGEPHPLVPLYLRRPDAKEPTAKPKSPAIPDVEF